MPPAHWIGRGPPVTITCVVVERIPMNRARFGAGRIAARANSDQRPERAVRGGGDGGEEEDGTPERRHDPGELNPK